ncbi:MAG: DUF2961 domain-containing protein, partial [bacterium]|nr:DUF2961 domain-containing protein [bacterium]
SHRFSGALDYDNALARTGGYRFFIGDAYAFRESILQTIEHSPTGNSLANDYAAVTFFYADDGIQYDRSLAPVADRAVTAVDPIVFNPGWNLPIRSFSLRNASVAKKTEKFGDQAVRYLEMNATGEDRFGAHHIAFECKLPHTSAYAVSIEAIQGPDAPTVQLSRNENLIGEPARLHAETRAPGDPIPLGTFRFNRGPNELLLKVTSGKLELIRIIFAAR